MIEGDPAAERVTPVDAAAGRVEGGKSEGGVGGGAHPTVARPRVAIFLRLVIAAVVVAGVTASGLAIYHGQRDVAQVNSIPLPSATTAPSVADVITLLETKLRDHPDDTESWRVLGWSYFQNGRYGDAATALRQATRLDPTSAQTYSFLGESLVLGSKREGRIPREARIAFDKALKLDPHDARARYFRAVAMDLAGQHHKAIEAWFDLLADTPADAPYAADVRAVIRTVGARHGIEVEKRLAEARFASPGTEREGDPTTLAGMGPSAAQLAAAGRVPPARRRALIGPALDGLAARLHASPGDVAGWITLIRGQVALGDPQAASHALSDALAACGKDKVARRKLREAAAGLGLVAPDS